MLNATYLAVRRALVFIIGGSVVLVGVIMLVTPGPGLLVIPAGLALLATEFLWARRLLNRLKESLPGSEDATGAKKSDGQAVDPSASRNDRSE